MAKFVQAPIEEKPPEEFVDDEPTAVAESDPSIFQDPMLYQALAVMVLAALATVFVAMMLNSLLRDDRKAKGKPAALTGADYAGKGFGGKDPVGKTTTRFKR